MITHAFGGEWTREKLERVGRYLKAYTTIFRGNPRARFFKTTYVDAFAGTGFIDKSQGSPNSAFLFPEFAEPEAAEFMKGSAHVALDVNPPFDSYLFIERDPAHAKELAALADKYPEKSKAIKVVTRDANGYLAQWCKETEWNKNRAVVFLDPYGMQVEWSVIEAIANTRAIDLWYLFPAGAINRLLTKERTPPDEWKESLTRCLGTSEWEKEFYSPATLQQNLFGEAEAIQQKQATFDKIAELVKKRLGGVFAEVAPTPLWLRNSKNVPLFLLCFAAGNPTAVKIADYILKMPLWPQTQK